LSDAALPGPAPAPRFNERAVIALVGAVQFVNVLDFMMVMPLGPDFARSLGIPQSMLGLVGGSYTAAAAVGGIIGAFFLDRFDRRKALGLAMAGLAIGTLAGAFAVDLKTLLLARVVAGLFGGPATAVALAIIADVVPPERRGRAMGAAMGAFSVASVLGVPAGLEVARLLSWRAPFVSVAALSLVITTLALYLLPPLRVHLEGPRHKLDLVGLFTQSRTATAYALVALVMASGFLMIPNFSAFVQGNLHFPREQLGLLYGIGGVLSFGTMRLAGRAVDAIGSFRVSAAGVVGFAVIVVLGFMLEVPPIPILVIFPLFMVVQTTRNVAQQTLLTKVPRPHERAGFLSVQSAVGHLASATGAIASSQILVSGPGNTLIGMPTLGAISISLALAAVPLLFFVERAVLRERDHASPSLTASR
jgi:predicted MFS family arabinose efflux permease